MVINTYKTHIRAVRLLVGCVAAIWLVACSSTPSATPSTNVADKIPVATSTPHALISDVESTPGAGSIITQTSPSANDAAGMAVGTSPTITSTDRTDPSVIDFSLSDSNHTPPADVLQEVAYWEGAGGGPGPDCESPGIERTTIWPSKVELMQGVSISSCDWQPDEQLTFTLTYPTGISRTSTELAKYPLYFGQVGMGVTFTPQVTDPPGRYSVQITGLKKSVQGSFEVVKPTEAQIQITDAGTLLYGFSPGEHIRYFSFQFETTFPDLKCTLAEWQEFTIGPEGYLLVRNAPNYSIVIGEISGEVHLPTMGYGCGNILFHVTKPCPNAPDSRLSSGRTARVISDTGSNVRVRSGAGTKYDKVTSLSQGTIMSIVDGPVCSDRYVWWKVKVYNGQTGWVAEGEPGSYFIQPW